MSVSQLQKNNHLLLRAGFGPELSQFKNLEKLSTAELRSKLFQEYAFKPFAFQDNSSSFDYQNFQKMDSVTKKLAQQKNRKQNIELNHSFLNQMVFSEDQLREKMAFFWHGHFATRIANSQFNLQLLNTLREKALGNFGDLLLAVSQSPAMLQFLSNQQNRRDHPNENFAREVMELFTLGRGNYTEKDVQEAARAFTGWAFLPNGTFFERPKVHDFGTKTFLGKTGNFNGEDVLKIILEQKTTAKFITTKIYKFFVNEKVNASIIEDLSKKFFASNFNIRTLMENIFSSPWFYNEENIGTKIKSPIELIAGMRRILPMEIQKPDSLIIYQKLLGQMLLYPPNVAGWPAGKSWIDSSTLMVRLQMPQIWSGLRPLNAEPKSDDDVEMGMKSAQQSVKSIKNANITIDWEKVDRVFQTLDMEKHLLQRTSPTLRKSFMQHSDASTKSQMINLMSTPEFQMM